MLVGFFQDTSQKRQLTTKATHGLPRRIGGVARTFCFLFAPSLAYDFFHFASNGFYAFFQTIAGGGPHRSHGGCFAGRQQGGQGHGHQRGNASALRSSATSTTFPLCLCHRVVHSRVVVIFYRPGTRRFTARVIRLAFRRTAVAAARAPRLRISWVNVLMAFLVNPPTVWCPINLEAVAISEGSTTSPPRCTPRRRRRLRGVVRRRRPLPRTMVRTIPNEGSSFYGLLTRLEVRRTVGGSPLSSYTVLTVLVCVMLRMRRFLACCRASSANKSN